MKYDAKNFMSLGGFCLSIYILGKDRPRGPVDNILIQRPKVIELLLENKYLSYLLKTTPKKVKKRWPEAESDYDFYFEDNLRIVHNNAQSKDYFIEVEKRVKIFNAFLKEVQKSEDKFFVFSLPYTFVDQQTHKLLGNYLEKTILYLKSKNILHKTIFIGSKPKKSIKKIVWYNSYLNTQDMQNLIKKYKINYIELNEVELGTSEGKEMAHKQFIEKILKFSPVKPTVEKKKQAETSLKKDSYLNYNYYGLC